MRPSWVVGFPFTLASSPLTGFATVDGLGALAGDRPLALRFHDAFGFRPRQQCPTHLLRERNAVADLDRLQGSQQVLVQTERGLFQRGHVVLCITSIIRPRKSPSTGPRPFCISSALRLASNR